MFLAKNPAVQKVDSGFFKEGIIWHMVEPARPVLRVFSSQPLSIPRPIKSVFDLEPSDEELNRWAEEGKILATFIFHSGELSHHEGVLAILDLLSLKKIKIGWAMHAQRYEFASEIIELMQVPPEEGGVLGLVEPLLHSSGWGIIVEARGFTSPERIVEFLLKAQRRIAQIAGEKFTPRGVYPYLDATPGDWNSPNYPLWERIRKAGFSYVVSSVNPGENRLLYEKNGFVVINQCSWTNHYPYSPFRRVVRVEDIQALERRLNSEGKPGWIIGVLDSPLYGYLPYVWYGEPYFGGKRLIEFFDYILEGGNSGKIISALPHTIARYARILKKRRFL